MKKIILLFFIPIIVLSQTTGDVQFWSATGKYKLGLLDSVRCSFNDYRVPFVLNNRLTASSNFTFNPINGTLTASVFSGYLDGVANFATSADYANIANYAYEVENAENAWNALHFGMKDSSHYLTIAGNRTVTGDIKFRNSNNDYAGDSVYVTNVVTTRNVNAGGIVVADTISGSVSANGILTLQSTTQSSLGDVRILGRNFDFSSTTGSTIVPRVTTTQRDAFGSLSNGMVIYNTTLGRFQFRENNAWTQYSNNALSNLTTTAINLNLTPANDNAISLGTSSKSWRGIRLIGKDNDTETEEGIFIKGSYDIDEYVNIKLDVDNLVRNNDINIVPHNGIMVVTQYSILPNNSTISSQSLVSTGLSVYLYENSIYEFEAILSVASSTTTGNVYGVGYVGTDATIEAQISGTLTATSSRSDRISAFNTATPAYVTVAGNGAIRIQGIINTGSDPGNFIILHAKVSSGSATVYANSYLKVTKVKEY